MNQTFFVSALSKIQEFPGAACHLQVPQNAPVRRSKFSGVACYSQVHENASEAKLSKERSIH